MDDQTIQKVLLNAPLQALVERLTDPTNSNLSCSAVAIHNYLNDNLGVEVGMEDCGEISRQVIEAFTSQTAQDFK